MSGDLTRRSELADELHAQVERLHSELAALELSRAAPATLRAYARDLGDFGAWCAQNGFEALPASGQIVALYLIDLFDHGHSPATILRRRAAIAMAHRLLGDGPNPAHDPVVVRVAQVLRRAPSTPPGTTCLERDALHRMVRATPSDTKAGARDRALLLLGFAGGLGPSELVALNVSDGDVVGGQLFLTVPGARVTNGRLGRLVVISPRDHSETCPVTATRSWIQRAGIHFGPLFRPIDRHDKVATTRLSPRAVAAIIRRAAAKAGLDARRYDGRSFRIGSQHHDR